MNLIRKSPATAALLVINVAVFFFTYLQAGSFDEPGWSHVLLAMGAEFNPYTLNGEWYRIFTHMFLHGGILHIVLNMFGLYVIGTSIEPEVGSPKFLWIYFLSGIGAALASLYWMLFAIGVGASGAIFGVFGFFIIRNIVRSGWKNLSTIPIIISFGLFLSINLYLAEAFKADTAAHLGGLAYGLLIGAGSSIQNEWFWKNKLHYLFVAVFVAVFFALPRYQVKYFNFFQSVLAAQDSANAIFDHPGSDEYYLKEFKRSKLRWDSVLVILDNTSSLPQALHSDTFKLRRYIQLHRAEAGFRIKMIERESYIFMDSIGAMQDSMQHYNRLDYPLMMTSKDSDTPPAAPPSPAYPQVKVLYNEDWEEVSEPPFTYYRIGSRDSLNRWQGRLTDFYANGDVQMKGSYKDDERHGIFLYYSDHKTYSSGGRYNKDLPIGKWEIYHNNGKLQREEYYADLYFMKNQWDSLGNQQVSNGNGKVTSTHSNGVVSEEGEYRDGYKEGYWYGRHSNGEMYFEENYYHGQLTKGRSRTLTGETFIYDESSQYPMPEGGYPKLREYLQRAANDANVKTKGVVRLSFRVTEKGNLTDFKTLRSISIETGELAKQLLKAGPRWIPAKEHGHKKTDGFAFAEVEFR